MNICFGKNLKTLVSLCGREWLVAHQTNFIFMVDFLVLGSYYRRCFPVGGSEEWACLSGIFLCYLICQLADDSVISKAWIKLGGAITWRAVNPEPLRGVM